MPDEEFLRNPSSGTTPWVIHVLRSVDDVYEFPLFDDPRKKLLESYELASLDS